MPPRVPGRSRRTSVTWNRLATVVFGGPAPGETMRVPPVQEAAAVRVPAPDRVQPLQEALLGRLTVPALSPQSPAARQQDEHECPDAHLASHGVWSPPRVKERVEGAATPDPTQGPCLALSARPGRSGGLRWRFPSPGAAPNLRRGPDRR